MLYNQLNTKIKRSWETNMDKKTVNKVSRNDPCPCGSGRKYKNCHGYKKGGQPTSSRRPLWIILGILALGGIGFGGYRLFNRPVQSISPTGGPLGFDPFSTTTPTPAGYYSDIPGVILIALSEGQKKTVLDRANREICNCGCNLTLASCIITDPGCPLVADHKSKIQSYVTQARGE
ncbi:SEC-C domain-containing protein [candidate division TA06 bacterium]|nr:SEC-C domain-containing protein [candidate division TA06 bacterium]